MVEIRAAIVVLTFLKITSLSCLEEKRISNILISEVIELWNLD